MNLFVDFTNWAKGILVPTREKMVNFMPIDINSINGLLSLPAKVPKKRIIEGDTIQCIRSMYRYLMPSGY